MRIFGFGREPQDQDEQDQPPTLTSGDGFHLRSSQACDRGVERPNNEDATMILQIMRHAGDQRLSLRLLAVADGMGGAERGEVASRLTLSTLATYASEHVGDVPPEDIGGHIQFLQDAFAVVNERVHSSRNPQVRDTMGTTLVLACTIGPALFVGNVGDSRCYLFRDGMIERATKDDSLVQQMVDAGALDASLARSHPKRNVITKAIGIHSPDRFRASVTHVGTARDFEHILLSSDGLHGVVTDEEIAITVRSHADPGAGAAALVDLAKLRGSTDNISVVLASVVLAPEADSPPASPFTRFER